MIARVAYILIKEALVMMKEKLFALILVALLCVAPGCEYPELETGDVVSFTLLQTTDVHHRVIGTGPSATY